ncbi:MAG: flagellar filament capping protein FliD [Candidatus Krumholzibacteriota bacterium]|nr:flagellar filament capping protein FliD [Candidatus Krumholzibacteriota bacterium]
MAGVGGISGLVSGLDTADIISKLIDLERRPIYALQERISRNLELRGAYETLEANLEALKIDSRDLYRRDRFLSFSALSTNEDIITAQAGSSAVRGSYTLSVSQLAQRHQIGSGIFSDKEAVSVGTGTITITNGTSSPVEITIDSSNNTLEKVAVAINDSGAGVQAVVVNIGGDDPSYKLIISGDDTGASQRIVIDEDLTGGTGLQMGSVGTAVEGTWTGSAVASALGNYTGNLDASFTFTVASGGGGTIGSDTIVLEYTDGGSNSGTITIPASYAAGTEIDVFGGLQISLAAGTVVEGDSFSVDVTSATIQAAVNAQFTLGSATGGGTPIMIQSATNTVTDLIDGVSLELISASAGSSVTINVGVDSSQMVENVDKFINRFNEVIRLFNNNFKYDEDLGQGGSLFGEVFAIRLNQAVRQKVTDVVQGLPQSLNNLTALGVSTNDDGTLTLDSSILGAAINEDPEAVVKLFTSSGTSTDADIQFMNSSSKTVPTYLSGADGYEVNITSAARRALQTGNTMTTPTSGAPLVIDSSNNRIKIILDGKETSDISVASGTYTSGEELASAVQNAINSDDSLGASTIIVEYVDDGGGTGHFEFTSTQYGSSSMIRFSVVEENSIYSSIGMTTGIETRGTDVAGTINGEEATGTGQYLTGKSGNEYTDGLRLLVTISAQQLAAEGQAQGTVTVSKGIATRLTEYITDLTDVEYGALTTKKTALEDVETSMKEQIEILQATIDLKERALFTQFVNLETALAEFQAQESFLTGMIDQLQGLMKFRTNK